MPRASRQKAARRHAPAVLLPSKRSFAVSEPQVTEHVLPGEEPSASGSSSSSKRRRTLKVPEGMSLDDPLPAHPYSRSHAKREKRKARQQLVGGELGDVAAALEETLEATGHSDDPTSKTIENTRSGKSEEAGRIKEGRGRTLGEKKRRKAIAQEKARMPRVMAHPEFKKDPWATVRLHASNTLAM